MMNNPKKFIEDLKALDLNAVLPEATWASVNEIVGQSGFKVDAIRSQSPPAAKLANWVIQVVEHQSSSRPASPAAAEGALDEEEESKKMTKKKPSSMMLHMSPAEREALATKARQRLEEDTRAVLEAKREADECLVAAMPALEEACRALDCLDKRDITELKSLAKPPPGVMGVLMAVVVLRPLGREEESGGWAAAKSMLGDVRLLSALRSYDKDKVTEEQICRVKSMMEEWPEAFEDDKIKKVSKAAYGLSKWVRAMVQYHEVAKVVAPKRALVRDLEQRRIHAEAEVSRIEEELLTLGDGNAEEQ